MKQCTRCKKRKPLEAFSKTTVVNDGYYLRCKQCEKARHADYYQSNKIAITKRKAKRLEVQ